jgi:AGZA family xanthine/uracil permease-like MFS transporter
MFKFLDKYFGITELKSSIPKELIGGLVTFMAMLYILVVNPSIMSAAGMDTARMFTSTAIAAGIATLVMAFVGRLPIALAPGLGINAFVAFSVCGAMGFPWQVAILAIFVEGVLTICLSLSGIRQKIVDGIPDTLKKAVALGIGLFIAVIGMGSSGMGILDTSGATGVALAIGIPGNLQLVAVIGLVLMIILHAKKVPGAIFISIVAATIIGIPLGVTTAPASMTVAAPYTVVDVLGGLTSFNLVQFIIVFISIMFVDLFDTISTFAGIAEQGNLKDPDGGIRNGKWGLLSDSIGTTVGSLFGCTSTTSYVESSAGVASGARTGLASVVTGLLFLLAIVAYPLLAWVPAAATGPALVFVGFLMLGAVSNLDFTKIEIGLPTFIAMVMIPFSYSISIGLAWGFVSYAIVMLFSGKTADVKVPTWVLSVFFLIYLLLKYAGPLIGISIA